MIRIFLLFTFSLLYLNLQAQMQEFANSKYPFEEWTQAEIDKANTAKNASYLSQEEKNVILFTNLARINGDLYSRTFVPAFMDKFGIKSSSYSKSLIRELKNLKELSVYQSDKLLYSEAKDHAVKSGKRGATGHQGFDKRYKNVQGKFGYFGENCDYGYKLGWEITTDLLIDEGIQGLGHRKAMLNTDYTHVGVAIADHKKYRVNCVMDFGG